MSFGINFNIFRIMMLVNDVDDSTMGFMVERESEGDIVKEYEPAIIWNLRVLRYTSVGMIVYDIDLFLNFLSNLI